MWRAAEKRRQETWQDLQADCSKHTHTHRTGVKGGEDLKTFRNVEKKKISTFFLNNKTEAFYLILKQKEKDL